MDRSNTDSTRGQVGIGTLIVFIALVLIASIGAGVLLNTADLLQSTSSATGQDAVQGTTDRIQVYSEIGNVSAASELVKVTVYNDTHLKLIGYVGETYDYSQDSLLVKEGETVWLHTLDNSDSAFIYGNVSASFTQSELQTVNPSNHAKISFEIIDDNGNVRLYDELDNQDKGVANPPVSVEAASGTTIDFGLQEGSYDHSVGNSTDSNPDYPAGSSYVLNHTEQQKRDGPLNVVENVTLSVRAGPGSGNIDIKKTTIKYVSNAESGNLIYSDGKPTAETFTAQPVMGSDLILEDGEKAKITFNTTVIGSEYTSLPSGSTATVLLDTSTGGTTTVELVTPKSLSQKNVVDL